MNEPDPPAPIIKQSRVGNLTDTERDAFEGESTEMLSGADPSAAFRALFDASPTPFLVVTPHDWTIVEANRAYLRVTGKSRETLIGRQLFAVFPEDPDDPSADGVCSLAASLGRVVATGSTETMAVQRHALQGPDGRFVERWWAPVNTPVLGKGGVVLILHNVEDVSEAVRVRGDAEGQDALALGQQAAIDRLNASEAVLRESEEFNRRVLQSSADCIKVLGLDGRLEQMSVGGQRALGIADMAAYLGAAWAESFEPDWRAAAHAAVKEAADGRTSRFEGALTTAKGELRWWDSVLTPISGADGGPERVLAVSRDITALRVARDRMREGEARFRNMADNAPVMMWVTDPSGYCTYLNARWYEFTGQEPGTGESYGWLDAIHPDDRRVAEQAFIAANAEHRDYRVDFRLRRADGVYRWTIDAAAARFSQDGEFLGYVGSVIDIDERREAEERLALSEEQLRLAIEVAEIGQWDVDHVTGAMFWPPRVKAMFGISPDVPVTLDDFHNGVHPDDREKTRAAYEAASDPDRRPLYDVEYRTIGKEDGVLRWVAAKGRGIFDAAGRCVRVIGTAVDVTARKADEVRLRELNETLEQRVASEIADRAKAEEALRQSQKMEAVGQLTGGLAHDFNNLLTGISGSLELMQTRMSQGRLSDLDRYINAAQGASRRAAALTHRLLAFSRRQTLEPRPTDINRLIHGLEELISRTVGPSVRTEVVGSAGLWTALVDPNQLENAVLNLCINGRDAMPEGGRLTIETANRWLDVRAAAERDVPPGQYLSLCVTDTGTGMTPEIVARAFEPFFTTKPLGEGTGLGLSMIYGFARQSGGHARIYSELGQGTTVCLYLPRHLGPSDTDSARPEVGELHRAEEGQVVLVVDDEATVRMLVTEVLEDLGYTAIEAKDGPSGLAVLRAGTRIDLLVTDVGLPGGMNGRQVADAGRVLRPGLKVLFITGYAENAVVGNDRLDRGMQILTKPFLVEDLAMRIKEMLTEGNRT